MGNEAVIKTLYVRPKFAPNNRGKKVEVARDALIVWKADNDTGKRKFEIIPRPKIDCYISKEPRKFHELSVPLEEVEKVTFHYKDRNKVIAEKLDMLNEFFQSFRDTSGGNREFVQRKILNNPNVYMADMDIEDYYKTMFVREHGDNVPFIKIRKSFMDIEVDTSEEPDFDQRKAKCPITSICHLDKESHTIYAFLLRMPGNEMQAGVEKNDREFFEWLYSPDSEFTQEGLDYKIRLKFFDKELDLIENYFQLVNETTPDLCGIWNSNFDILTILNRIEKLGGDRTKIISHPSVPAEFRNVWYNEDHKRFKKKDASTHWSRYFDWFDTSTPTQFYDQMSLFSNMRKRFLEPSYKLDIVGEKYGGIKKVNLEDQGYHIRDVIHKNYFVFLKYALKDVIVQDKIETKTNDLESLMVQAGTTKLRNAISVSYVIKNVMGEFLHKQGRVIGNNVQYDIFEKAPGAIVALPELINKPGITIKGSPSFVFKNVIDFDAWAEYPNIMIAYNILKTTVFGRVYAVAIEKNGENMVISDGNEFNKKIQTFDANPFEIGSRFMGLPTVETMIREIRTA